MDYMFHSEIITIALQTGWIVSKKYLVGDTN